MKIQFHVWCMESSTSEVDLSLLSSLHLDSLIIGFIALHLEAGRRLVAHKALFTLQHQHRPAPPPQNCDLVKMYKYIILMTKGHQLCHAYMAVTYTCALNISSIHEDIF